MGHDFIKIKSLDGELKISHKLRNLGLTISTRELVVQKPHVNYHIKLDHIVSIVPFELAGSSPMKFVNRRSSGNEVTHLSIGSENYKFYVREAVVHNRSGIFRIGPTVFVMPVILEMLGAIAEYSGLNAIAT